MPSKKPKKPAKSETPDGDPVLVRRVDALMSVDQPDSVLPPDPKPTVAKPKSTAKATTKKSPGAKATKTAPKLSPKLLEGLETSYDNEAPEPAEAAAEPPLVIKLADEGQESPEPETDETEVEPAADSQTPEAPDLDPIEDPGAAETDPLENNDTDKAVDDIVAHESDTVLAVNDALVARKQDEAEPGIPAGPRVKHKWAWFIFLIIVVGSAADLYIFLSK